MLLIFSVHGRTGECFDSDNGMRGKRTCKALLKDYPRIGAHLCTELSAAAVLGSVHTCNVTAYRNAVTLQVADTVRSCELNLHPLTVRRNSNHHA
jgi:hypothetical protein